MDSSFERFMLGPSKCSNLSMDEKRDLVYEVSKWSHGGPEMLQSWSRRELLQILCAEMGKERKYTGLTKCKMIEHLLRIVSEKKSRKRVDGAEPELESAPANSQSTFKRLRKTNHLSRLPIRTNHITTSNGGGDQGNAIYCQNSACRASIQRENAFCKRCSCCICHQYDENKDPSLWLVCSSEPPYKGDACGMSCHLDCALKHERVGIAKVGQDGRPDGSFYCASCGKVNDLLGCWRKQLMTAKDTRRVDILCFRVSLCQKLLRGTEKYQKPQEIVDMAAEKLEAEVGPLAGPVKMARGIVNRLSSGPEVQKLCAFAVESLDSLISYSVLHPAPKPKIKESCFMSPSLIRFEDVCPTSLIVVLGSEDASSGELVGYTLWHCKADVLDYSAEPTCTLFTPNTRFSVLNLAPATEYLFKVVSFSSTRQLGMLEVKITTSSPGNASKSLVEGSQSPATNSSSLSNPSSEGDESNNVNMYGNQHDNPSGSYLCYCKKSEKSDSIKPSDDASNGVSGSHNTGTGSEQEEMLGDSTSVLDEECILVDMGLVPNLTIQTESQRNSMNSTAGNQVSDVLEPDNKSSPLGQLVEEMSTDNGANVHVKQEKMVISELGSEAVTLYKQEIANDGTGRSGRPKPITEELDKGCGNGEEEPQVGSLSKKMSGARWDGVCARDGSLEREYEYCVKVIRLLECEGHIDKNFRVKFLTWYSLRATPQERKIVKVFVNTLINDPVGLAVQLVDSFSECIISKRPLAMPTGFCMKLWH